MSSTSLPHLNSIKRSNTGFTGSNKSFTPLSTPKKPTGTSGKFVSMLNIPKKTVGTSGKHIPVQTLFTNYDTNLIQKIDPEHREIVGTKLDAMNISSIEIIESTINILNKRKEIFVENYITAYTHLIKIANKKLNDNNPFRNQLALETVVPFEQEFLKDNKIFTNTEEHVKICACGNPGTYFAIEMFAKEMRQNNYSVSVGINSREFIITVK